MKKALWGFLVIVLIGVCASCEFSFGEKQEPVYKGAANPDMKVKMKYSPEKIDKIMTEDLSDRGWKKTKTVINQNKDQIEQIIKNFPIEKAFKNIIPQVIITIPYVKEAQPNTSVTLTFYDLNTPFNAFSVFSRARQVKKKEYYYGERKLILTENGAIFWEGPFLITVLTSNLGKDAKNVLLGVSKGIAYKLYGLIGTYEDPDMTQWFPSADRKEHSIQVLAEDPFQLKKPRVCMKAEYEDEAGLRVLYIFTDASAEHLVSYRRLMVTTLMNPGSAILASKKTESLGSRMWVNSQKYGIAEIILHKNILAVQTGIGAYQKGIEQFPGLRDISLSSLTHENYNNRVTINPYKNHVIIQNPDGPNSIIPLGNTIRVIRNAKVK